MKNIKFGRLIEFDNRSRKYPIRALIPKEVKPRSYTWRCLTYLDQKDQPACVGFSITHEAAARPVVIAGLTVYTALALYRRAQKLDEYPGEGDGTSILGGMKAATEKKWYREYRWAFGEQDLCLAVGYHGPAVLGINWYTGMMEPDSKGIIRVSGQSEGGHAILCVGYSLKSGFYRLHNSWGVGWGFGGDCFINKYEMAHLLTEQGEACIPITRLPG